MSLEGRARDHYEEHTAAIYKRTDRFFAVLLCAEWVAAIAAALWLSPKTWEGLSSETHPHVLVAVLMGGLITLVPVSLCLLRPGEPITRQCVAAAQMLFGAMFVQLSGGRIETHFHYFGSLAFLAFYRDWRVLVTASVIVASDHFMRGVLWPESVYGTTRPDYWRWLEHASWVIFEDACLFVSIRQSRTEMVQIAERRAQHEVDEQRRLEHAEARLVESDKRFRLFMDNGPAIAFIKDAEGRYIYVNAVFLSAMRTVLRIEDMDPVGRTDEDLLPAPTAREVRAADAHVIETGKSSEASQSIPSPDGTLHSYTVYRFPLVDAEGRRLLGGIGIDITHRHELEEQIRQSQKMEAVGRLAGGVAHDFNNLLTVINGYCDLLLQQLPPTSPLRTPITTMHEAGARAAALTEQLLAFSRRQVVQPVVLDLNEVTTSLDKLLRRLIGDDVTLVVRRAEETLCVRADSGQLDQVLINLVVNAADAITGPGRIEIQASARHEPAPVESQDGTADLGPKSWVVLSVADDGCGMDEATRLHIFEPFFSTKQPGKGTGLGLATVHSIVSQSGGFIRVTSAVGTGTVFDVYLPRDPGPPGRDAPRRVDASNEQGHGTVVVAEDNDAVRLFTREILETAGYTVIAAADGLEALEKIRLHDGTIDLVVTDSIMPRLSGPDLARHVTEMRPSTKILLMSGYTDRGDAARAIAAPGTAFLQKPFPPHALLAKVRELLAAPATKPSSSPTKLSSGAASPASAAKS